MREKILALDIDGTLTNSEKDISPATKAALFRMMEKGHKVILASGRPSTGIRRYESELELAAHDGYVLAFNGACITRCGSGKIVYKRVLPKDLLPELYRFAAEKACGLATHRGDVSVSAFAPDRYVELEARINGMTVVQPEDFVGFVDFDMHKCLMTAEPDRAAVLERQLQAGCGDRVDIYRSDPYFIEIMPQGVDKGAALEKLLEILGARWEDVICCGDGFNDIPMLRWAGVGVAMGNAGQAVKDAADYVTGTNDEDGLLEVIRRFVPADGA